GGGEGGLVMERQHPAGNDAVQMEVRPQLLVPGMQDQGGAEGAAQVLAAELQQRSGRGVEQQVEDGPLVLLVTEDQRVELMRQRENVVEVGDRQQLGLAC